jgi:hypothetical protein
MGVMKSVILEEKDRLERALNAYQNEINKLPKGSIQMKLIKGNKYAYRAWREDKKVITQRVKDLELEEVKRLINKRQRLEKQVKEIKKELKYIEKVIK